MVPENDLARRVLWNLSFSVDKDSIQSNVWTIKWICTRTIQEVINSLDYLCQSKSVLLGVRKNNLNVYDAVVNIFNT